MGGCLLSIINNMISDAILVLKARVNYLKTTKLHEPVGLMQFLVFQQFTSAYLRQIAHEIMLLPILSKHPPMRTCFFLS